MRHHGCQPRTGGFRVDDGDDVYDLRARACLCGVLKTHVHCYYIAPLGLPVVKRSPLSNPKLIFCPRAKSLIIRSTDLSSSERLEISASSVANCSCFCRSNRSLRVIVRVNAVRVSKASPTSSATNTAKKKTETAMAPENSCVTSHSANTSMCQVSLSQLPPLHVPLHGLVIEVASHWTRPQPRSRWPWPFQARARTVPSRAPRSTLWPWRARGATGRFRLGRAPASRFAH